MLFFIGIHIFLHEVTWQFFSQYFNFCNYKHRLSIKLLFVSYSQMTFSQKLRRCFSSIFFFFFWWLVSSLVVSRKKITQLKLYSSFTGCSGLFGYYSYYLVSFCHHLSSFSHIQGGYSPVDLNLLNTCCCCHRNMKALGGGLTAFYFTMLVCNFLFLRLR